MVIFGVTLNYVVYHSRTWIERAKFEKAGQKHLNTEKGNYV